MKIVIVIVLIVLAFIGGLYFPRAEKSAGRSNEQQALQAYYTLTNAKTTILLTMENGKCTPSDPMRFHGRKNDTVTWTIRNVNCDGSWVVEIKNFRKRNPDGTLGSIDPNVMSPSLIAGQGAIAPTQSTTTTGKINESTSTTTGIDSYKYEIWLAPQGSQTQLGRDPDFDIWP